MYIHANLDIFLQKWISGNAASAVNSIEYCPSSPYDVAVTYGTRVDIINVTEKETRRSITKFKDIARCASFRKGSSCVNKV
jgi:hypothetical protein